MASIRFTVVPRDIVALLPKIQGNGADEEKDLELLRQRWPRLFKGRKFNNSLMVELGRFEDYDMIVELANQLEELEDKDIKSIIKALRFIRLHPQVWDDAWSRAFQAHGPTFLVFLGYKYYSNRELWDFVRRLERAKNWENLSRQGQDVILKTEATIVAAGGQL